MITFTADGYPTEESLAALSAWRPPTGMTTEAGQRILLEAVRDAWNYADRACETRPGLFVFSTGGWSGNEDLIVALEGNTLIRIHWDRVETPGGLYCYAISEAAIAEMDALHEYICSWAWRLDALQGAMT